MNILIIGSGAREHALADCFSRSPRIHKLIVSPGNAGIALEHNVKSLPGAESIYRFCQENLIDYVVIGGEQPVADGVTDFLRERGIRCIGPSRVAGQIETSKTFAKDIMAKGGVPTARYMPVTGQRDLDQAVAEYGFPLVLKADGLAGGKGVHIVQDKAEADAAILQLFELTGQQGVIAEEFLQGWELSLFAICDGSNYKTTVFSQDHKQLYDHDLGPNTGGMGAIAPVLEGEPYREQIEKEIIEPVIRIMREQGTPFQGFLYCGLMITSSGPKVLEFNCRWGDPEAEAVLPLLDTDLIEICQAIDAGKVNELELRWKNMHSIAVILASPGYPTKPHTGDPITVTELTRSKVFWAGVRLENGALVTAGGRVAAVCALGEDPLEARDKAYGDLDKINFTGKTFRRDIGLRSNSV